MDIVKLAINNARLTISVLVFLLLAGCGRLSVDAEGSGTRCSDPDDVCQPDLSGHFAGGFGAPSAAADGKQAEEPQGPQGDAFGRLPGWWLCAGRIPAADESGDGAAGHAQQGAGRQGRPAAGCRRACGHRSQHLRISRSRRHPVGRVARARSDGRGARIARPDRGGARRSRRLVAGLTRRSRRSRHRSDETVFLRAAARSADRWRRRLQQPRRRRQHRRLGGQIRRQGTVADRDAGGCGGTCRWSPVPMPWCRPRTSRRSVQPSPTPRRSPVSTASRPSPSKSRSASAPT